MVTEKGHYSRQSNNPYWIGKANRVLFFLRSYHLFYLKTKFSTTLLKKQFHHCYQSLKTYHLLWGFSYIYNSMGYIFLSVYYLGCKIQCLYILLWFLSQDSGRQMWMYNKRVKTISIAEFGFIFLKDGYR